MTNFCWFDASWFSTTLVGLRLTTDFLAFTYMPKPPSGSRQFSLPFHLVKPDKQLSSAFVIHNLAGRHRLGFSTRKEGATLALGMGGKLQELEELMSKT